MERVLPPRPNRRADAEAWLGELLEDWGVRSSSTGRWLSAAQLDLEGTSELVIFVQYDPILLLFTVEIWQGTRRIHGIDDWLG